MSHKMGIEPHVPLISAIIQIFHCFEGNIPSTPKADGNITSQGFPGTEGQTIWYISREAMK